MLVFCDHLGLRACILFRLFYSFWAAKCQTGFLHSHSDKPQTIQSQGVDHSFCYEHNVVISWMTNKKLCKLFPGSIYCVLRAGFILIRPVLKTTKLTTKLYKSLPRQTLQARYLQPVMRWALNSLVSGTWTNCWKAALTGKSNISDVQYHQWHTEPSLRFLYTGHVPVQRAVSMLHSSVQKLSEEERWKVNTYWILYYWGVCHNMKINWLLHLFILIVSKYFTL